MDGVLRSWAVPRGPSLRPGERRLAVETEDHPLAYRDFAGVIPVGEYGAGHMAIFDHGTWEPDGDEAEAIRKGRLDFELHGERLKGRWSLIRTNARGNRAQWMLLKRTDAFAADIEADDLIADLPAPPADAPGASTREGLEIRARKGFDMAGRRPPTGAAGSAKKEVRASAAKTAAKPGVADDARPSRRAGSVGAAAPSSRSAPRKAAGRDAKPVAASRARAFAAITRRARSLAGGATFPMLEFVEPMLTVAAPKAPSGEDWVHEWKWDGYRLIARSGRDPQVWSRNGLDWNERAPELVSMLAGLGVDAVLDGELIAVDRKGYSDFNALQRALSEKDAAGLRYVAFDVLAIAGHDLRAVPLLERKRLLEEILADADPRFFYSTHIVGRGQEIFDAARGRGMEGIISKRADSRYEAGRSQRWLKVKTVETRDFVVVGYTPPKGGRRGLGALMLAQFRDRTLVYAGRVGSGLGNDQLLDLHRRLQGIETGEPVVDIPDHVPLPAGRIQWVRPELVVEVFFRGWAKEGLVRQASFHRLRDDKPATAAALEQPEPVAPAASAEPARDPAKRRGSRAERPAAKASSKAAAGSVAKKTRKAAPRSEGAPASADGRRRPSTRLPALSSPDRIVYPDAGYTKQDVFDYYLKVAPKLLGEIGGRLLSVVRCPDGIGGQHFFQRHARSGFGEAVHDFPLVENDGDRALYFHVDDVEGLMALVQMNAIEFHPWGSRVQTLEQPDRMVFDLDPDPSLGWADIKTAAKDVRDRLQEAGLASYPKLSGGKGVHVVVPLAPRAEWEQVRSFCAAFAEAMQAEAPERYVATMSKAKRKGRIFIDWLRNGRGATSVASWSLRARPGAPAAVPLTWSELSRIRTPQRYTLRDAATRGMPAEVEAIVRKARPLPL